MDLEHYDSVTLLTVFRQLQEKPIEQRTPEYIRLLDNLHMTIRDVVYKEEELW